MLGEPNRPAAIAIPHWARRWAGGTQDIGGFHQERHPADRLHDQRLALQRLPGEEEQVERIPQTDPPDDQEDSVAEQVLPELRDVWLKEPRGEQQPDDEQDRPATE